MRFFRRERETPAPEPKRLVQPMANTAVDHWPAPPEVEAWSNQTILAHVLALSPTEFEHAVARLLPLLGYKAAKRTGGAGDRGIDIVCYDRYDRLVAVQCKRYSPGKKVTAPDIQTFYGMMLHRRAHLGIYVTTSTFTKGAFDMAADLDIRAIDGAEVGDLFAQHPGVLGLDQRGVQPAGRTSYYRQCQYCGRRIQMRVMPDGKWLPFDRSDSRHDCRSKRT
jgi:hypothetical protein